jgi:hypothetical protein
VIVPNKRDYPKEIVYDGEVYKVKWVRKFEDPDQLGECCSSEKVIRLRLGRPKFETFETFLHEILHLIEFEHPIDIKHSHVYKMSEALAKMFIENF